MYNGYDFYFKIGNDLLTLPITPGELTIKSGSNNKTVTLISEGEVNILKSPSLTEIEFEARFPMRKYPYSRIPLNFEDYLNKFTKAKEDKRPIRFSVVRSTPKGNKTWGTSWLVSLEELETNENADEGDDVIVSFKLKQYKEYGVKTIKTGLPTTTSTSNNARSTDSKGTKSETYTVKSGDCLWNIAKAAYGDGSKWTAIYNANKSVIESTAEKYRGKGKGSSNGHWIYPGTVLTIPDANTAKITVQKLKNNATKTGGGGSTSGGGAGRNYISDGSGGKAYALSINISGISSYAGEVKVTYYNSENKQVTLSGKKTSFKIYCYKRTYATVYITSLNGHSFQIINTTGMWSSSSTKHTCMMNKDSSISIKWVR